MPAAPRDSSEGVYSLACSRNCVEKMSACADIAQTRLNVGERDRRRNQERSAGLGWQSIMPRVLIWAYQDSRPSRLGVSTMASTNRSLDFVRPFGRRSTKRWPLRVCLPGCALVLASAAIANPTFARSNFDGEWSVVIETRSGACTPTLRYPVAISNGIVTNAGENAAAVTGRVAPTGAVRVAVQAGGSWASGSGHLGANSGTGVWRGQGTTGGCVGTWQAQRRSSGAQVMERGGPIYNYAPQRAPRYYSGYPSR
jgi:hypothetical protein